MFGAVGSSLDMAGRRCQQGRGNSLEPLAAAMTPVRPFEVLGA